MIGDRPESTEERTFHWLGRNVVGSRSSTGSRRIKVPEPAREAVGLSGGDPVHWAFETEAGLLVMCTRPLSDDEYKNQGPAVSLGDENDDYRVTIPSIFFADHYSQADIETPIPEPARVGEGEDRHFVAHDAMVDRGPRTCWLLTRRQVEITMGAEDTTVSDRLNARPQFLG
jgi:hypothetical protein